MIKGLLNAHKKASITKKLNFFLKHCLIPREQSLLLKEPIIDFFMNEDHMKPSVVFSHPKITLYDGNRVVRVINASSGRSDQVLHFDGKKISTLNQTKYACSGDVILDGTLSSSIATSGGYGFSNNNNNNNNNG